MGLEQLKEKTISILKLVFAVGAIGFVFFKYLGLVFIVELIILCGYIVQWLFPIAVIVLLYLFLTKAGRKLYENENPAKVKIAENIITSLFSIVILRLFMFSSFVFSKAEMIVPAIVYCMINIVAVFLLVNARKKHELKAYYIMFLIIGVQLIFAFVYLFNSLTGQQI